MVTTPEPDWRAVLDLEDRMTGWGPKARAWIVRDRLGISPTRFTQLLLRALETPEAAMEYPALVARLERLRAHRRERVGPGRPW